MKVASNIIVVGGMIAAGKSSLVGSLPFKPIQELDPNDELQRVLIKEMYEGDIIAKQVFQLDMLLSRFDKYKKASKNKKHFYVFDRMIFEDHIFAKLLLGNIPNVWEYYNSIWKDKVDEMINKIGKPKFYVILDVDWENFQDRIFKRNRKAEIDNFESNKEYFYTLHKQYVEELTKLLNEYSIDYFVINTNEKTKLQVIEETTNKLINKGIINVG